MRDEVRAVSSDEKTTRTGTPHLRDSTDAIGAAGMSSASERSAHVGHDDPHAALGQAEHLGEGLAHGERILRPRPHRQLAALVVGDGTQRLERKVVNARQGEGVVEDEIGLGKRAGGIAAAEGEVVADVAGDVGLDVLNVGKEGRARPINLELRRARRQGLVDGADHRERSVLHRNMAQRLLGAESVDRRHGHDGLAGEADALDRQHGLITHGLAEVGIDVGEIGTGEDGEHAGMARGL